VAELRVTAQIAEETRARAESRLAAFTANHMELADIREAPPAHPASGRLSFA
jgi:hypothetical protein